MLVLISYRIFVLLLQVLAVSSSASQSPPTKKSDIVQQLVSQLTATHALCQQLLTRQERFEEFIAQQLFRVQGSVDELLLLSPIPFHDAPLQVPTCNPMPVVTTQVHTSPSSNLALEKSIGLHSSTDADSCVPADTCVATDTCVAADTLTSTPSISVVAQGSHQGQRSEGNFLAASQVLDISHNSCSRENFASNLVKELFTKEERAKSNVKGMFGKPKLCIKKIEYVRQQTLKFFPVTSTENEKKCWANCVKAIDSASRQLNRTMNRRMTLLQEKENILVTEETF